MIPSPLDLLYIPAAALTAPWWLRKARGGWRERFGRTPPLPEPPTGKPRILLHGVSVGEISTLRGLVPLLAPHADVVVSASTDTGLARAKSLFSAPPGAPLSATPAAHVVRYPLDLSSAVRRFLDAVRPAAVALVELELWPNFVRECERRSIPVVVINGRLSPRSFRGYRRFRSFLAPTFARLHTAAVQDAAYAERFAAMGVPDSRIRITGSMKWDSVTFQDHIPDTETTLGTSGLATVLGIDRAKPLIVAGSTGPTEEALLHAACPPGVQLLCAPRKPERADEAAAALPNSTQRRGRRVGDQYATSTTFVKGTDRFLLATIGELRAAYSLATLVVVGRSFGGLYGSDPIEPIALGKTVVIGPAHADFQSIVDALRAADGIIVSSPADLPATLAALIADPERRAVLAANGRTCITAHQGATRRHADLLLALVGVGSD